MTPRQAGLLVGLALLWGSSYLLIKLGLEDFSPTVIVFLRTALGALVLYGVIHLQGREARAALVAALRSPGRGLALAAVAIAIPFLTISFAQRHVASGLTAVLIASAPIFVAALAPFLDRREVAGGLQAAGLVLGLAGVGLLVGVEIVSTTVELLSALGIVAAAACYALSTFVVRGAFSGVAPLVVSVISVGGGALLTALPAALTLPDHAPSARSVLAMVGLGVACTAGAFAIFYRLIAEMGGGRASLVTYLIPVVSLTLGAALLAEPITVTAVAGLLAILAGVALASRGPATGGDPTTGEAVSPPGSAEPPSAARPRTP